jgi:1-acyl-sn-glycerol-3-phosphate acyltransferase
MAGVAYVVVTGGVRGLLRMICRVEDSELAKVPPRGPLIIIANHVNFLDAPMMYTHLQPRPVTGFAKIETWENPLTRVLFDLWEAIPISRGEVDREAFRQAARAFKDNKIVCVAPEGTRSGDGRLQRGYPGVVLLAAWNAVPLLPVVYYGHEGIWENLKHFKRSDYHMRVGNPFTININRQKLTKDLRLKIADEIMYQIAALLPPVYRGRYSNLDHSSEEHLCFAPGVSSNLVFASHRK